MAQRDLITAFDDCIDRLNAGETLDSCLRSYPHLAAELQPMLQVSQAVRSIQVNPLEIQLAQTRARARLTEALQAPATPRPPVRDRSPLTRLATLAALFVLVMSALLGGASITAQDDLPGDALYGLKRLTEAVRLNLSAEPSTLQAEFAQRRIDEISALLAIPRGAPVEFTGEISVMGLDAWLVAGLPLQVPPGTPGAADRRVGDVVHVMARTTNDGSLIADQITLLDEGPAPTPTPTQTAMPSPTPTLSATPSVTLTPWSTSTTQPTSTATPSPRVTVTPSPSQTPAPVLSPTATTCVPTRPDGWVSYQIRSGDTLSTLAALTGITLEEVMQVNCLTDARLIVVGQQLFLPFVPVRSTSPEINDNDDNGGSGGSESGSSGSSGGSTSGGSGGIDDNSNDNGNDDDNGNDNDDDDDDDGGSSNSGSGSNSNDDDDDDDD